MKKLILTVTLAAGPALLAQNVGTFSGPSVLTQGANTIGQRSGQDLDLRFNASATGVYDNGLVPFAISEGSLVRPQALYGVEAGLGAYGRHSFRRSVLGLDYQGNFRHYSRASFYDGSNQNLNLGYTVQTSRRVMFDFTSTAGTQTFGLGFYNDPSSLVNSNSLLFDNRTSYVQGGMNTTVLLGSKTSVTMGGTGYTIRRKATQLAGVTGYTMSGTVRHQVGRNTTVGASYQHMRYDFTGSFGETDINAYTALLSQDFGRTWRLELSGGVYTSAVQGTQTSAVDPVIAALLGVSSVQTIFYRENRLPMASIALRKQMRRSSFTVRASRSVNPGNGLYLASRMESYGAGYSYTGRRRVSFSLNVDQYRMSALAQQLQDYRQLSGSANLGYRLGGGFQLNAAYARRRQDIQNNIFLRDSSRVSIGIFFQPGDIPLSFH